MIYLGIAILINLVSILSLPKTLNSFDIPFHINRVLGAWLGWHSGQFIPYINPVALHGLGLGSDYFYGTWQAMILALVFALTHSIVVTFTIFNTCMTWLAGILMDKLLSEHVQAPAVMIASSFYLASPFMLHNLFVTQDQGAIAGIVLLPVIFIGFIRIMTKQSNGVAWLAIGAAALLSTHLLSTFLGALAVMIVLVMSWRKLIRTKILKLVQAGILALILSAFYWVPLVELKRLNLYSVFFKHVYSMDRTAMFLTHSNSWQPYSILIKIVNLLLLAVLVVIIVKWRSIKNKLSNQQWYILSISLIMALIFSFLSYAPLNWKYLPSIFYNLQFLWRFMLIGYFFIAISIALLIQASWHVFNKKHRIQLFMSLMLLILGLAGGQVWQYSHTIRHNVLLPTKIDTQANAFKRFNPHSKKDAWYFEYASLGVYEHQEIIDNPKEVISAHNATTKDISHTFGDTKKLITAQVSTKSDNYLIFKKIYYPGYFVKYQQQHRKIIKPATYNSDGLVAIRLPNNYQGSITVGYQTPIFYLWMWAISIITFIGTLIFMLKQHVNR